MRSPRTATKSSPRLLQLEKARAQQQRPNAAKERKKKTKKKILGYSLEVCVFYKSFSADSLVQPGLRTTFEGHLSLSMRNNRGHKLQAHDFLWTLYLLFPANFKEFFKINMNVMLSCFKYCLIHLCFITGVCIAIHLWVLFCNGIWVTYVTMYLCN